MQSQYNNVQRPHQQQPARRNNPQQMPQHVPQQPQQQLPVHTRVHAPGQPQQRGMAVPNVVPVPGRQARTLAVPGQTFTSGAFTFEILGNLDPQSQAGPPRPMSDGVFKVRRVDTAMILAMKRLKQDRPGRTRAEVNVAHQIRDAGRPRHLNMLVQFLLDDVTMQSSLLFEFCDMGNVEQAILAHRAARTNYEEKSLWIHAAGVVKALAFLHEGVDLDRPQIRLQNWNTIAHLDIKPANIFLSSQGGKGGIPRVVLGDFGCAVSRNDIVTGRASKWTIRYGTTGWYPPETAHPTQPRYGKPTDVWQLGGVLQVMSLLSNLPSLVQLNRGEPCSDAYSDGLNRFVSACMHLSPEARPNVLALANHLQTILGADF